MKPSLLCAAFLLIAAHSLSLACIPEEEASSLPVPPPVVKGSTSRVYFEATLTADTGKNHLLSELQLRIKGKVENANGAHIFIAGPWDDMSTRYSISLFKGGEEVEMQNSFSVTIGGGEGPNYRRLLGGGEPGTVTCPGGAAAFDRLIPRVSDDSGQKIFKPDPATTDLRSFDEIRLDGYIFSTCFIGTKEEPEAIDLKFTVRFKINQDGTVSYIE